MLPRLCGNSNAKLAVLTSLPIKAAKALSWNMVSEVVETPCDLLPAAMRIAEGLVYNKGPILRALKKSMDNGFAASYGEARKIELESDHAYFQNIGDNRPKFLVAGAAQFNKRVKELDTPEGMRGGIAGPE